MLKNTLLVCLVLVAYFFYARFVLNPYALVNFSLIDDGQLVKNGYFLRECVVNSDCRSFKTQIIDALPDVGLSRAGSWLIHGLLYQGDAVNAQFQHVLRVYGFGSVMILLLILALLSAKTNKLAIVLGAMVFVSSYSFTENIIRLGPIEPYVVIFLGLFSVLFLNLTKTSQKLFTPTLFMSSFVLVFLLLIKEATVAILPAIFVTWLVFPKVLDKKYLGSLLIVSGGIYVGVKYLLRGDGLVSDYADNYVLDPVFVLTNSVHYLRLLRSALYPFFDYFLLTSPIVLFFKQIRSKIVDLHLFYWLVVLVMFTTILFPWRFVFDRYLLPAIFAFSAMTGILLGRFIDEVYKHVKPRPLFGVVFYTVTLVLLSNVFFLGAAKNLGRSLDYRNWFAAFTQFEADQVNAIAQLDKGVYLNAKDTLANWEVSYEIPLHIAFFDDGKPLVQKLEDQMPKTGYVLSSTSLDPIVSLEDMVRSDYLIIASKDYFVDQIAISAFYEDFKFRPIQTILKPPLAKEKLYYYWEIRQINEENL